jgi:hypothetical protein
MIKQFDKSNLKEIRTAVDIALAGVGSQFGIKIKIGNMNFGDHTFTSKVEASVVGVDTRVEEWSRHFWKFDLSEDWLHKTFTHNNDEYKIVGLRPRATKNQILIERNPSNGRTFRVDSDVVREKFGENTDA